MIERRKAHRRHYQARTEFPLFNRRRELIAVDRRRIPTRRINDIAVEEFDCSEFISEIDKYI
jgi:hypothetical protein